jgi:hypothetical protein
MDAARKQQPRLAQLRQQCAMSAACADQEKHPQAALMKQHAPHELNVITTKPATVNPRQPHDDDESSPVRVPGQPIHSSNVPMVRKQQPRLPQLSQRITQLRPARLRQPQTCCSTCCCCSACCCCCCCSLLLLALLLLA